jgi:hypothetical protein
MFERSGAGNDGECFCEFFKEGSCDSETRSVYISPFVEFASEFFRPLYTFLRPTIPLDNVLEINREIHVQREESGFRTRGRSPEGEWSGFGILCADRSGTVVRPPEGLGGA